MKLQSKLLAANNHPYFCFGIKGLICLSFSKFKLLHPIFRSTIIRGAIEHYKISEDDIENEIATSLPYWLGIDENSAKCMLQDYMITSREPAFGEPGPKDLPDAISFLLQASLPLTLLYPWVDPKLATPSPDVSDRGNVDAFDSDSALDDSSTVIATLDSNSNTFSYLYYNHTYDSVESQCHINAPKSLQPSNYDRFLDSFNIPNNDYFNESGDIIECNDILDMEKALYKGNKLDNISTENTSQSKDLSAENKIYSDQYLNNDGVDLSEFPLLSSTCAPPATLISAMAPKAQDIFCNDSLKAQEATFPNKLKGSLNITTQTPHYLSGSAPTTSWTDNDVLKSGMSISSNMAPNKYGDQNRFQGYSGCYFSQGYHYDTQQISNNAFKSTQVKGKAKAEPNTSIAAEATATSMTGAISQGESKGKAKVFDISNTTTAPANAASFYYPGLPPMYTFNSLQSNVQGESLSQACPPKRKRGRPRKDTSVVIDANGHAAIRATDNGPSHGAASARAENAIAGNKPKRAKKMAQPRAAPKMNAFVAASNARAAAQAARAAPISTTLGSTVDAAEGVVARDFAAKS